MRFILQLLFCSIDGARSRAWFRQTRDFWKRLEIHAHLSSSMSHNEPRSLLALNPSPGPLSTAVPIVPSVILNIVG